MTAKRAPQLSLTVHAAADGRLEVVRARHTFRFLFADGTVVDVAADSDDSVVRGAVLTFTHQEQIAGVAQLPDQASLL